MRLRLILGWGAVLILLAGCGPSHVDPPAFDGARSYQYLIDQVAFGPRVPGSEAWRQCRAYFYEHFRAVGLSVDSQVFSFIDPYSGRTLPLVNVIARAPGGRASDEAILLMAHWDSRPRTDYATDSALLEEPIDGANDGASGVAILMELANMLAKQPPPVNVDLVLSDGEDWGRPSDLEYYAMGAAEFAHRGIRGKYRFGIVVDLVGDKDQRIPREGYSEKYNPHLNDMIWKAAADLGVTTFVDLVEYSVHDDHMPLNVGGVPTVDIIDLDYPYWHTEFDTPDKCSAESLTNVGRVLAEIVYNPSRWP